MQVSCGIILETPSGILICHPTGSGKRWDFPKGRADEGESHWQTAVRETREETGLNIEGLTNVVDLGEHYYNPIKTLHLYHAKVEELNIKDLFCTSTFFLHGKEVKEMNGYQLVSREKLLSKLGPSMVRWLTKYFFKG